MVERVLWLVKSGETTLAREILFGLSVSSKVGCEIVCLWSLLIIEVGFQRGPCESCLLSAVYKSLAALWKWKLKWNALGALSQPGAEETHRKCWQHQWRVDMGEGGNKYAMEITCKFCLKFERVLAGLTVLQLWLYGIGGSGCIWNHLGFLRDTKLCWGQRPSCSLW